MCWELSSEGAEMCHDDPYKSSRYQNPIMIPINVLLMVKWLGLPYLYAITNEALQEAFGTTTTPKKIKCTKVEPETILKLCGYDS
jgi:hypothetical protein